MNTHYYSREQGAVVRRPAANPQKVAGYNAGRKRRNADIKKNCHPLPGMPISRAGRDPDWIAAYQKSYYRDAAQPPGRPNLGNEPRVTISVTADRDVVEQLEAAGISRYDAFLAGAQQLLASRSPTPEILSE